MIIQKFEHINERGMVRYSDDGSGAKVMLYSLHRFYCGVTDGVEERHH